MKFNSTAARRNTGKTRFTGKLGRWATLTGSLLMLSTGVLGGCAATQSAMNLQTLASTHPDTAGVVAEHIETRTLSREAPQIASVAYERPSVEPQTSTAEAPRAAVKLDGNHRLSGGASWYGPGFHGRLTANGETYDQNGLSAAHKTLPLGSVVRVKCRETGKSVEVRVNDRGPYAGDRVLDLSKGAAQKLGVIERGVASVDIEVLEVGDGRYKH